MKRIEQIKYNNINIYFNGLPIYKRGNIKSGVYMIDNIYIGQSIHILNRIKQHIKAASNIKLKEYLSEKKSITITVLDYNIHNEERHIIDKINQSYPLFTDKQYALKQELDYNFNIIADKIKTGEINSVSTLIQKLPKFIIKKIIDLHT